MRNPYDRTVRNELVANSDEKVLWDAAYYNGRYYVYFGFGQPLSCPLCLIGC